jgi:hypothetical protein
MHMRKYFLTAFVLAATLVFATSGLALEKSTVRMGDDTRTGDWNAGATCSVAYYNTCTGWLWVWSGWSPLDCLGTCFDNCCPGGGTLDASDVYVWTAAPSGYGFTGTISLHDDTNGNCCPDEPAAGAQVFFPISGWNLYNWGVNVGSTFITQVCLGPTSGTPIVFPTDHPAAGPTGPQACGLCYPSPRVNHSYYYGTSAAPLCPGSPLNDGVCDAQLWMNAYLSCTVSVEQESWGKVKNLYR